MSRLPLVTLNVTIPQNLVGRLMGQGGSLIRTLQAMPHVKSVRLINDEVTGFLATVQIRGFSAEAVQAVADRVHELVYELEISPAASPMNRNLITREIPIPAAAIPFLFGKNNQRIHDARATPGLKQIILMQNRDGSGGSFAQLKGETEDVLNEVESEVKEAIESALNEAKEDAALEVGVVSIPKSAIGFIIGKDGGVIRSMQRVANIHSVEFNKITLKLTIKGTTRAAVEQVARYAQDQIRISREPGGQPSRAQVHSGWTAHREAQHRPISQRQRERRLDQQRQTRQAMPARPQAVHRSEERRQTGASSRPRPAGAPQPDLDLGDSEDDIEPLDHV